MRFFKTKHLFYIVPVCLLTFVLPAYSAENIALGKSYTLYPPPNYHLCTDDGDARQLTDGKYSKSHWSNVRTVGWFHPLAIPQVTIDLERVCTIERVDIHTTAGRRGGIDFSSYAVVLVSDDGINFQIAGYKQIFG